MDGYGRARRVMMAEVTGGRVQGRPRSDWMDGVKVALGNRGMTMEAARQCTKDRKECNWMSFTQPFLLGPLFFRTALKCSGGYHMEREGCRWDKLKKGRNYWKSRLSCQVYGLRGVSWWLYVCVLSDLTTPPCCREKVMVYYYFTFAFPCFCQHLSRKVYLNQFKVLPLG